MAIKTAHNMDKVLYFKSVLCYVDDVLIVSETFDKHLSDINNMLSLF